MSLILMWQVSTANLLPDFSCDVVAHGARSEAADILGDAVHQPQAGADDVRGVVHRDHLFPVVRPAVHVLRMRRRQVLDLAQFALLVHLLDEQELAAVDDRLGHHVFQPGLLDEFADLLALFDRRRHRHGAHDVLAGLERLQRHPGVVGNRRVDVDEVDLRVGQHVLELGVPLVDPIEYWHCSKSHRHWRGDAADKWDQFSGPENPSATMATLTFLLFIAQPFTRTGKIVVRSRIKRQKTRSCNLRAGRPRGWTIKDWRPKFWSVSHNLRPSLHETDYYRWGAEGHRRRLVRRLAEDAEMFFWNGGRMSRCELWPALSSGGLIASGTSCWWSRRSELRARFNLDVPRSILGGSDRPFGQGIAHSGTRYQAGYRIVRQADPGSRGRSIATGPAGN